MHHSHPHVESYRVAASTISTLSCFDSCDSACHARNRLRAAFLHLVARFQFRDISQLCRLLHRVLCLFLLLHSPPMVNSSESFFLLNGSMILYPNRAFETCELLNMSYIWTSGASFELQGLMSDMCHVHVCTYLFSPKSPISPVFFSLRDFNVPILHVSLRYFGGWSIF